jgi:hypothetical protein
MVTLTIVPASQDARDDRPIAMVVPFDSPALSGASADDRRAAALDLAARLTDNGPYRVLDADGAAPEVDAPALADRLRHAEAAGIRYLIVGSLQRHREVEAEPVYRRPPTRSRWPAPLARRPVVVTRQIERVVTILDVRLIDVPTGRIVLTASCRHTRRDDPAARAGRALAAVGRAALTVVSAGTIVRERRPLDAGLEAVVRDIAEKLSTRAGS